MELFTSEQITKHVTRITEITGTHMYLAEGEERALLVDTGCGIGDLAGYIRNLTEKPVTVICTHGHMDHAGGTEQFEKVYLNREDWKLTETHCSLENRKTYTQITIGLLHPEIGTNETEAISYMKTRTRPYEELKEAMKFDLGGFTVQVFGMKGHTAGSMCVLFPEERKMLFGDACNPSTFLFDVEAESVEAYRQELLSFKKHENLYDTVWFSHGPGMDVSKEILGKMIEVCEAVLQGTDEKADFHFFMGGDYKAAYHMLPNRLREDGGLANLIYNPQKIFNE